MACSPEPLGPVLTALLECANDALIDCGRPATRVTLLPGNEVAWDDCCSKGGQLWVRLAQLVPTGSPYPSADASQRCGVIMMLATVEVGVLRCAATIDDHGMPPTVAAMTADAEGILADASATLDAITCCFPTALVQPDALPVSRFVYKTTVGTWNPLGPSGGCAGGTWTVQFGYDPCLCYEPPPEVIP